MFSSNLCYKLWCIMPYDMHCKARTYAVNYDVYKQKCAGWGGGVKVWRLRSFALSMDS